MTDTTTLPPLPVPIGFVDSDSDYNGPPVVGSYVYSGDQMQAYARAALAQSAQAPAPQRLSVLMDAEPHREWWTPEILAWLQEREAAPAQTETDVDDLAHEIWAAAQLAPGEGVEDGVKRIASLLAAAPAQPAPLYDQDAATAFEKGLDSKLDAALAPAPAQPAPSVEAVMGLASRYAGAVHEWEYAPNAMRKIRRDALIGAEDALRSAVEALARGAR